MHARSRARRRWRTADVDFRELVDRVPRAATFTMVSDSCHSGGLIDQENEQIGPDAVKVICCTLVAAARG